MLGKDTDEKKSLSIEPKEFHPLILRKDGSFCVYLPEWKVSGVGSTLEEAYRNFDQNYKAVEARAAKFGLPALTPEPYPILKRAAVLQELSLFFFKIASSAFIVILLVVLLLPNIAAAIRHNLKEMLPKEIIPIELKDPKYWALEFPSQMNAQLDRLEPKEEEKMRNEWSELLGRTVPIVSPMNSQPKEELKHSRQD
ncbi:MAG: Uncharacterised protein [Gammaproteobacteria bacterium]|nr:MAG: Uncharacterised protein [Gammaproteobacteria bacterium]